MPDAEPDPRLDALLDEVLAAPEAEQATTLQRSCEANPDAAPLLRRRFDCLVRFGLCSTGAAAPLTGTVLGDYRLGEALGGGGMGSVYRAERLRDGLVCALKVMHAELQRLPAARERLLREGRIASELRHRNLGEVLEVGHAGGVPFLAMRLVRGESLAQQLQREPAQLSGGADEVGWTVAVAEKVALALGALHARGLVHRDVKPANVLLDDGGEPVLVDFGLAREIAAATLTLSGTPLGTPAYMPPEQVRGEPDVTPAADVYSLGATLFECLAQRPPFTAGDRQTLFHSILVDDPPDLLRANRFVPKPLWAVVLRCLDKRPAHRYADGAELARDLLAVREGRRVAARLPGPARRALRWGRRHPVAIVAGFAAALLLALVALLALQFGRLARASAIAIASDSAALEQLNPVAAALLARDAWRTADTYATRSRLLAALANLAQVGEVQVGGTLGWFESAPGGGRLACGVGAFGRPAAGARSLGAAPAQVFVGTGHAGAWSGDGRTFAVAGAQRLQSFDGHSGAPLGPVRALSAAVVSYGIFKPAPVLQFDAGGRLHIGLDDGCVHSFGPGLAELGVRALADRPLRWLQLLPGGGFAALADDGVVVTHDAAEHGIRRTGRPVAGRVSAVSTAAGSPWLAFGMSTGRVMRARIGAETAIEELGALDGEVTVIAIGGDGDFVAAATTGRTLWVRRTDGRTATLPHACNSVPNAVSLSADGGTVALGDYQGVVRVFDSSLRLVRRLAGHREAVNCLRFVDGDARLASASWDGTIRFWDLRGGDAPLLGAHGAVFAAVWHPDGKHLLGIDYEGLLLLWDETRGLLQACATEPSRPGFAALAVSHDGCRIATGGNFQALQLWRCTLQREPQLVCEQSVRALSYVRELRFARDGMLYVANGNSVVAVDPSGTVSWSEPMSDPPTDVLGLALSSAEDELAAARMDGQVVVLDRQGRRRAPAFAFDCPVWSVAFAPAARTLAVGLGNGDVVVTTCDGGARTVLRGHDGHVRKVAWSADGAHLLSGGADGTVRLWRADGTPVCELQHPGIVHWVAFAADGQSILSAGSDGAVRIRPLPVGDLEAQAARVFRDYTAEERQRFAPLLR